MIEKLETVALKKLNFFLLLIIGILNCHAQKVLDPCFTSLDIYKHSDAEQKNYNDTDFREGVRKSDSMVLRLNELIEWTGSEWMGRERNLGLAQFIPPPYFHPGRAILVSGATPMYKEWNNLKIKPQCFALKLDKPLEPGVEAKFVFAYTNLVHSWGWPLNYDTTGYSFTPEIYCDSLPNIYDRSKYDDHYMPEDITKTAYFLGRLHSSGHKQWVIDTLTVRLPSNMKNQTWLIISDSDGDRGGSGIFYSICNIHPPIEIKPGKNIVLNNVFFNSDKSELLPASFAELDKLVSYLKTNSTSKIEISGYTDNTGVAEKNLTLSTARAKAVADYLTSKGISGTRVSYKGYGSANPIADNSTEENKKKNRRVEFKIVNK